MDLESLSLQTARLLDQRMATWQGAILAMAENPSVETIAAMQRAEGAAAFAQAGMAKVQEVQDREGAALLALMGVGSRYSGLA